jgi:hypothetical protein
MKWIAYFGSIILGTYLAYVALRAPAPPRCPSGAWRLVMPPPAFDPSNHQLLIFDEQQPFTRWRTPCVTGFDGGHGFGCYAFTSKNLCQQDVADHMQAALITADDPENVQRVHHALECVCADDPRFN